MSARDIPVEVMQHVFALKAVPLFQQLRAEQLLPIADIVRDVSYEADETIFEEGQEGYHLYVIIGGEVDVIVGGKSVARLGANDCFGEMALLEALTRSATVRTRTDVALLAISRDDFLDLLDLYPVLARSIIGVLVDRLRKAGGS